MMWISVMAVGLVVAGLIIGILMQALNIASAKIDGLEARVKVLLPLAEERRLLEIRLTQMRDRELSLLQRLTKYEPGAAGGTIIPSPRTVEPVTIKKQRQRERMQNADEPA